MAGGSGGALTGGTGGVATGGSGGALTGGTGGVSTGGASGSTTGTGGSVPVDGGGFACQALTPAGPTITDFSTIDTSAGFIATGGITGRIFTYPATMTVVMTPALSIKGTVAGYSGFGIWLNQCVDASSYSGISFTIGGTLGTPATLMLQAKTNTTTPISPTTKHGACVAANPNNTYADCWDPVAMVTVPGAAATVTIKWTDFSGGKPSATVNPKEILGFQWSFNWAGGDAGVAYAADVTLDDLAFVQ
jgi:hypothetical protein